MNLPLAPHEFTPVQAAVIACAADGLPTKTIAMCIGRSYKATEKLFEAARQKVGAVNITQLVAIVARRGLV